MLLKKTPPSRPLRLAEWLRKYLSKGSKHETQKRRADQRQSRARDLFTVGHLLGCVPVSGVTMPTYRLTIERTVRFQLDLEADSRIDALRKVTDMALDYDDRDLKETRVISVQEPTKPVQHPFD
jgi:hypothetical protein